MFANLVVPCMVSSRFLRLGLIALVSFFSHFVSIVVLLTQASSFSTPSMVLFSYSFMLMILSLQVITRLTFAGLSPSWDLSFLLKTWAFFTIFLVLKCIVLLKDSFYAKQVLDHASIDGCKPRSTPLPSKGRHLSTKFERYPDLTHYRSIVEALQYLTFTHPVCLIVLILFVNLCMLQPWLTTKLLNRSLAMLVVLLNWDCTFLPLVLSIFMGFLILIGLAALLKVTLPQVFVLF
jgi:hypothetical protein